MKTVNLNKFHRVRWLVLGLVVLGAASLLATRPARRWVRHRAEALGAALLFKARTTPAAPTAATAPTAPVNATFYVRSYGGKCLSFDPPRRPIGDISAWGGSPVFISDCNGTAAQQIRVQELTDPQTGNPFPGHLVILRAGTGVIGKKSAPVFTQQAPSAAQSDNSAAEQASFELQSSNNSAAQIPLEVQPLTNPPGPGQVFALDGDSIILAADRNLVVEVQNHRGRNRTPLVLGPRDLDDSEFWDFIATDGSA
jgi:hypothetical protein